jgi:hypothetical protein
MIQKMTCLFDMETSKQIFEEIGHPKYTLVDDFFIDKKEQNEYIERNG